MPLSSGAPGSGQDDDEGTMGKSTGVTEEPDAEATDVLFAVAAPDH